MIVSKVYHPSDPGCLAALGSLGLETSKGIRPMKESYCGLCDTCPLDQENFLEALAQVRNCVKQFPIYWWRHCFPGDEGFSFPEFVKGLDWFLRQPECHVKRGLV
jgi:hypothetical protein